jgi:hypothetical protein
MKRRFHILVHSSSYPAFLFACSFVFFGWSQGIVFTVTLSGRFPPRVLDRHRDWDMQGRTGHWAGNGWNMGRMSDTSAWEDGLDRIRWKGYFF